MNPDENKIGRKISGSGLTWAEADEKGLLSPDLEQGRLAELRCLYPEAFSEGDLCVDTLRKIVNGEGGRTLDSGRERFGLHWPGKDDVFKVLHKRSSMCLRPEREKSVDFDKCRNVFIEGENLEVMKLLESAYFNKVKMIYIDPPYNTGKDFVYSDKWSEGVAEYELRSGQIDENGKAYTTNKESDGRFHSKWLSMMYPRLALARDLLRDDGVIFISIGDNEVHHLRMLCDRIFGEDNFVTTFHVEMSTTQGMKVAAAQKGTIVKNAEYVLCYCRDKEKLLPFNILHEAKDWDDHYQIYYNHETGMKKTLKKFIAEAEVKGLVEKSSQSDIGRRYEDDNTFRDFINENSKMIYRDAMCQKNFSLSDEQEEKMKRGEIVSYTENKEKSYLIFINSNNVRRQLLSLDMAIGKTDGFTQVYGLRKIRGDWWKDYYKDMMNIPREGGIEFKNGKKPVRLIKDLIKLIENDKAIVLDFFAGSCTTAHAVMQLNAEDGGQRRFVMVQIPEPTPTDSDVRQAGYKTIADIGRERIRRAAQKIKQDFATKTLTEQHPLDLGFKSFRLDTSNFKIWEEDIARIENIQKQLDAHVNVVREGRKDEDLLYEIMLKNKCPLTNSIEKISFAGFDCYRIQTSLNKTEEQHKILVCLTKKVTSELLEAIEEQEKISHNIFMLDHAFAHDPVLYTNFSYRIKSKAEREKRTIIFTAI